MRRGHREGYRSLGFSQDSNTNRPTIIGRAIIFIANAANAIRFRFRSRLNKWPDGPAPSLPLLTHVKLLEDADWLRASLTTFATRVASIVPGHFPAYVRVYHPFDNVENSPAGASSWRVLAERAGWDLSDPATAADFASSGVSAGQAHLGTLSPSIIDALVAHLRPATATPGQCFFAVWEGFGDSVAPPGLTPKLELLHRAYDVFAGPVDAALASYSSIPFSHQSANLWWPSDQAWCVATEIDFAWTYVGGSRACIDAILGDVRLDSVETSARARW